MDIYEELGVRRLVNARAILGRYGDSLPSQAVIDAMNDAATSHVYMAELRGSIHRRIAEMTDNEAAMVCSGAACGCMLSVAACMTGFNQEKKDQLPNTDGLRNEVIMHKEGRWHEHVSIRPTGVSVREIGGANRKDIETELERALTDRTAAILMCSFARELMIPLDIAVAVGRARGIPVIVDAAYEVPPKENFWYFNQEMGVDLAIFSGGKAVCGPASTGIVVGRKDLIAACELNDRQNGGIGLSCKVGKEELVGIYVAIRELLQRDKRAVERDCLSRIKELREKLSAFPFLGFEVVEHGRWGYDFGLRILFDADRKSTHVKVVTACRNQNPPIEVSTGSNYVYICVSTLKRSDDDLVASRLINALNESS